MTRRRIMGFVAILLGITSGCVDFEQARTGLYQSWRRENAQWYEWFKELAAAEHWKMWVRAEDRPEFHFMAIGCLDCGGPKFSTLYEVPAGRRIVVVARSQDGRVAFVEARAPLRPPFELGVIKGLDTIAKTQARVSHMDLGASIALGERHIFFTDWARRGWLYDMQEGSLDTVFDLPPGQNLIVKVAIIKDEFLLILRDASGAGLMAVLKRAEPYGEVSRTQGVANMLAIGDHIVIEKNEVCFLYNPQTGATERLTAGRLLTEARNDEFLFCPSDGSAPQYGTVPLCRYKLGSRSEELLWKPPATASGFRVSAGERKKYNYTKAFLSPEGRFLFVPWEVTPLSKAEVILPRTLEYEVYDLTSGEKRGSFLNLYEGRFFFELLGWAGTEQKQVSKGEPRE